MSEDPKPYQEVTPSTRKRNLILAIALAAAALFMYVSLFVKLS